MLATATKIEQLALNNQEANSLAKAVVNVQQYYPTHLSAKTMAWTNLIMVAGSLYGSRAIAIMAENSMKEKPAEATPNNVTILPTGLPPIR